MTFLTLPKHSFTTWPKTPSAPFIATHSNSKVLCKHPRNLTDDQFRIICNRGGLVGLNYFKAFLNDDPAKADVEDPVRARRALFVPRRRGRHRPWAAILTDPTCRMALRVSNP